MLREITIGQYYPANSILHKLDARIKIISAVLFVVTLFVFDELFGYIFATAYLLIIISLSKVPVSYIFKGIKPLIFLLLFAIVFNVFMTPGDIVLQLGFIKITRQGLWQAAKMSIRLIYLIFGTSILTLTTTPNNMTDAMESLFKPLKLVRIPVHEIAMMMSIALRFIPILLEETDKIMKAQLARGADFESGNLIKKAKSLVPILVPLFISAFRRANDLALAMEARCYCGGEGRTKMKPLKYKKRDLFAASALIFYLSALILMDIFT